MSVDSVIREAREMLDDPSVRERALRAQPYRSLRTSCPFGHPDHIVVRAPLDWGDAATRVLDTGDLCLDCRVIVNGGLGLVSLRGEG